MKILGWLFAKKEDEIELKAVKKLQKETRPIMRVLNKLFDNLDNKKKFLEDLIDFESTYYKFKAKFLVLNHNILSELEKLLNLEKLDELLLKHLLVLSATRLHSISEELGIKALHRSYKINNIEEAKRRSYTILKDEGFFIQLLSKSKSEFKIIRSKLLEYKYLLDNQTKYIKSDDITALKISISLENKLLEDSFGFKKRILVILALTKEIVGQRDINIRKESLYAENDSKKHILIFHSYANTPQENREMAGYFASKGYNVFAPRLPGHGTSEDEFYNTSMEEVCNFAQNCLDYYYKRNDGNKITVTGLSLGGMLSLFLATKQENNKKIKAVISINAFIKAPIEVNVMDKIPYGDNIMRFIMKNSGFRFFKKKSINLIKKRVIHFSYYLRNLSNQINFNRSFEEELTKEFKARIDEEFAEIIQQELHESPENRDLIQRHYLALKDRMEKEFRLRIRNKKFSTFDIQDLTRLLEFEFYSVMTYKGMLQLNELSLYLQRSMTSITVPVYIIQSQNDQTVDPSSAEIIYKACSNSPLRDFVMIPNAGHILILEKQREYVFKLIEDYVNSIF